MTGYTAVQLEWRYAERRGTWQPVDELIWPDGDPGSATSDPPDGEHVVYVFGWVDGNGPAVWRLEAGLEMTDPDAATRAILEGRFRLLADLTDGPYIIDAYHRAVGHLLYRVGALSLAVVEAQP